MARTANTTAAQIDANDMYVADSLARIFRETPLTYSLDGALMGGRETMIIGTPAGAYQLDRDGMQFTIRYLLGGNEMVASHTVDPTRTAEENHRTMIAPFLSHIGANRF